VDRQVLLIFIFVSLHQINFKKILKKYHLFLKGRFWLLIFSKLQAQFYNFSLKFFDFITSFYLLI